ncbi:unnamed protein product [Trichobilharzia regenti]|nr:unnamed protein product [Trichobilharzia regenti]
MIGSETAEFCFVYLPIGNIILNWLPFNILFCFGLVSVVIIAYRTYNFNDCPEAAIELMKLVGEAKKDLASKGFVCDS